MNELKEKIDGFESRVPLDEMTKILAHRIVDDLDGHPLVDRIKVSSCPNTSLTLQVEIETKPVSVLYEGRYVRRPATGTIRIMLRDGIAYNIRRYSHSHPHGTCLHTNVGNKCHNGKYSDAVYDLAMALSVMEHW